MQEDSSVVASDILTFTLHPGAPLAAQAGGTTWTGTLPPPLGGAVVTCLNVSQTTTGMNASCTANNNTSFTIVIAGLGTNPSIQVTGTIAGFTVTINGTGTLPPATPPAPQVFNLGSGGGTATYTPQVSIIFAINGGTGGLNQQPPPPAGGNLWFADFGQNKIGRISTNGIFQEFPIPTANAGPDGIARGPNGNVWFTEFNGNKVGKITPSGGVTEYAVPTNNAMPQSITAGPDGNMWVRYQGAAKISKITPSGIFTDFPVAEAGVNYLREIVTGSDGNLWFTEPSHRKIARMTPTGAITEFPVAFPPLSIATGPDGNIWFTTDAVGGVVTGGIGRITTSGVLTWFPLPASVSMIPGEITSGPDGNLWFFTLVEGVGEGCKVVKMSPSGTMTSFPFPAQSFISCIFSDITAGPDGNLWFGEYGHLMSYYFESKIGKITPAGAMTEYPLSLGQTFLAGITSQ
jgi:streptogramin lyase